MSSDESHRSTAPFDRSGGALCLDFSNTWSDRRRPERDRLSSYEHLVDFALQTGSIDEADAADLRQSATADPDATYVALACARALREAIYGLFSALAGGRAIAAADVARINDLLGPALSQRRVLPRRGEFVWEWRAWRPIGLDWPLAPIAHSAAELLTGDRLSRVRECDAVDCSWLFIDTSRNRSRRWCSMESCGNRAKARRLYRRRRARRESERHDRRR